jgi:hypothetical protein
MTIAEIRERFRQRFLRGKRKLVKKRLARGLESQFGIQYHQRFAYGIDDTHGIVLRLCGKLLGLL